MTIVRHIPIKDVRRRPDARVIDRDAVERLKASIAEVGLLSPIVVRPLPDMLWELVAGNHRTAAVEEMGKTEILAIEVFDDDLRAELAMIDENLCRAELSPADRAKATARRKAIYLELHPETAHGGDRKSDQVDNLSTRSFASETAAITGVDARTIRRDAERGEKVIDEALDIIRGTSLDTGVYLDKLKTMLPNEQVTAARRDLKELKRQARETAAQRKKAKAKAKEAQAEQKAKAKAAQDDVRANLNPAVKAQQDARAAAIAAAKQKPIDVDALVAELEEARETIASQAAEIEALKADNRRFDDMRVQFEKGGFEAVVEGKEKEIHVLKTQVATESADKVSYMREARRWRQRAEEAGWSNKVSIDIETGEIING